MLSIYLNILVAGCLTGAVYGLMALGLSVIFGVLRVVNFAHGEMMVIGMFGAFLLHGAFGLDPMLSLPIVAGALFVAGYGLQRGLINRYVAMPDHIQFLLLLALGLVLTSSNLMLFGPDARGVPLDYAFDSFEVGPVLLDKVRVYAASGAVLLALALWAFFRFTHLGKAIRACADNQVGAQVIGLDVLKLYAVTFGIGAACVGAAGSLMVLLVDVHPYLAADYTLLAFIIVILGGLGSFWGALLGGVLVGLSEALSGFLIAPSLKSMFSFGLLILVLLLRPQGLMGARQ
ncbi:branched-chain amino acid ABC transporter permease [Arenibaculum sp.]|jgi:branched-chain amino acid transport system permease protein|uniref:branched-chain amino acid ABC transporter permease n=1 Tax=Arenibaculum sp. TaxID=2865862 RepID=UPI002E1053D1|nr:branched-chain amino acid ABC transporter permease [Arenibaculum sp.]